MTQRELAQKAAISFAYVSKLETGVMPPPRQKIILALAEVLGVNDAETDELFGLAKKMPSDLLANVDTGMIKMLRSFRHGEETPAHQLTRLRRRIAELEGPETRGRQLEQITGGPKDNFKALVEYSPDGIVLLNSELEILYENPSASRILGYKTGEFVGEDTLGVIHPEDMSKAARRLTKMIQNPDDPGSHAQLRVRHRFADFTDNIAREPEDRLAWIFITI